MAFSGKNQKIYMVTGKGGVGKSTVAAGLAQSLAGKGKRVLLVELGDESYLAQIYGVQIAKTPVSVSENVWLTLWSGEGCLREYVLYLLKVKKIVDLFFENRIMRTFIRAAPALKELAILGKTTSGVRGWGPPLDYDAIVVDAFSTGHYLALLKAPLGMADLIESGPMGEQSRNINLVLRDPKHTKHIIVTIPEELPVSEAIELDQELLDLMKTRPTIVCNRIYEEKVSPEVLEATAGGENGAALFKTFLRNLFSRQKTQLEILGSGVGSYVTLPLVLKPVGREVIDDVSKRLDGVSL